MLTEPTGEQIPPIDRHQVLEHIDPIVDEVGHTQAFTHRVLVGSPLHKVHVRRVDAPGSERAVRPERVT